MDDRNWIDLAQDPETGIETIRAHFEGHAFDPHWHDSYLVGYTESGVQRFHCRRARHDSTPGRVFLLDPSEIHDGDAPVAGGFTYSTLYLSPQWLMRELPAAFGAVPPGGEPRFAATLMDDPPLRSAIDRVFQVLRGREFRIVRQSALDGLLDRLRSHIGWRAGQGGAGDRLHAAPALARQAQEYLHAHLQDDVGLDDLAGVCGVDRFRLTRAFRAAFGLPPHAYLVQLRLTKARRLLALGEPPAEVAIALGFADQSHLGRWFRRAYGLTPADYRRRCLEGRT